MGCDAIWSNGRRRQEEAGVDTIAVKFINDKLFLIYKSESTSSAFANRRLEQDLFDYRMARIFIVFRFHLVYPFIISSPVLTYLRLRAASLSRYTKSCSALQPIILPLIKATCGDNN